MRHDDLTPTQQSIMWKFAGMSTSMLIGSIELAIGMGTPHDDEATELHRRLTDQGKSWRWGEDINRVVVYTP